ncbi:MAG: hypothetical protein FD175_923 [Beijerinckiaceae bacterium]|nr:MAG: hypothetical protein FD175_923 [Beijerinckiaceae bacterium]
MKKLDGKKACGLTFGFALALAALSPAPAMASPFGAIAEINGQSALPLVDVQARRVRPAGRPVARNRGRNGAAVAGALIGAAIIGGAIIANSNQRRRVYVDDGYYDGGDPYYGAPTGYAVPSPYYGGGYYQQPQPVYRQPRSYYQPHVRQPYYGGQQPGAIIATPDKETPYTYAPSPNYQKYDGYSGRRVRDPAGGGVMR